MLPTHTAEQRKERDGTKMQIWGAAKVGKTRLAATLPPDRTLFMDCERGMLSIPQWTALSLTPESWPEIKDQTCFFSGPDAGVFGDDDYGGAHYSRVCNLYGDPQQMQAYDTIFIDSTTRISQMAIAWCDKQPEAYTKKGEKDLLNMYGLLSRELVSWAWRLQRTPRLNVVLIGGLKLDRIGQWVPMVEGGAADRFPYIFDDIVTMGLLPVTGQEDYRGLVCRSPNPWRYPAGCRSDKPAMVEPPDLGALIRKIKS